VPYSQFTLSLMSNTVDAYTEDDVALIGRVLYLGGDSLPSRPQRLYLNWAAWLIVLHQLG
jgi:hypothetical protein